MSFPCTSCGECCRSSKTIVEGFREAAKSLPIPRYICEFPYEWDENGACEKLTTDNKCSVYENRPILCNIEELATQLKLPKKQFFKINAKECNKLIKKAGLEERYLVPEEQFDE